MNSLWPELLLYSLLNKYFGIYKIIKKLKNINKNSYIEQYIIVEIIYWN